MKMLMIVIDAAKKEELEIFLNRTGVAGYTEISPAAGMGSSGMRLGSRAFPKSSAVILTLLDEESLERVSSGVNEFCESCGEKLRMISWDAEQIL